MADYGFYVGVDWGSASHVTAVLDPAGAQVSGRTVDHTGAALGSWVDELSARAPADQIAVAIEVPRGPVVEALLERGFHVYAVNPKQLDRFRDRHTVAGAKDDRRDAFVLADSLRTDLKLYRRLDVDDPRVIELREASRMHDELTEELGRLSNRLREQLWRYYPQALALSPAANDAWLWAVLKEAPTPAHAARLTARRIAKLLKARQIRRIEATDVIDALRQPALRVAKGTVEAASSHVKLLLPRLELIAGQLKEVDQRVSALLDELSRPPDDSGPDGTLTDVAIALSMTGIGQTVCAGLFSEAASSLEARDLQTLRAISGVAPVTRQSGKSHHVVMRRACNPRLRQAMWHWARSHAQNDAAGREYYDRHRARGHSHATTLRCLGERLLNVLVAMLRERTLYDPERRAPPATETA